jgi:hypothetical protein
MKKTTLISIGLFAVPFVAFAQTATNIRSLIGQFGDLLNQLIPIIIALTLIVFFFGLFRYVKDSGSKDALAGRQIMIAGIAALFVMVSVWGIVRIVQNTLGVQGQAPIQPPAVPILH